MIRATIRVQSCVMVSSLALALVSAGCKSELDNKQSAQVSEPLTQAEKPSVEPVKAGESRTLHVDTQTSSIGFVAAKVSRDHQGSFKISAGKVDLQGNTPTRLEMTVRLDSVETDESKLTSHLKTEDFFHVEKYPTSHFVATQFASRSEGGTHTVTGELELHGVKKQISFPATISVQGNTASGKAEFKINRKDFGIVYPGMPDDLIKDEVLLKLDLRFKI
jgi:polyisoprenoid-binding protein YceI